MNEQYKELNSEIADFYAQLDAVCADEPYDPQAYEQVAESLVKAQYERDDVLAILLLDRYNERFSIPIDRARALELARHANEQHDGRLRGIAA